MKQLIIILAILLIAGSAPAATYYMREDGTAANKAAASGACGTQANCMNVSVHNGETFSAGDIITLCDDGTDYTTTIIPPTDGSDGNQITYIEQSGDTVTLTTSSGPCVNLDSRGYITLEDLTFGACEDSWIYMDGSSYNVIDSCTFSGVASQYTGVDFDDSSAVQNDYNKLTGCAFSDASGQFPSNFITIDIGNHNLIENTTFGKSSHQNIAIQGRTGTTQYNAVKGCTLTNVWHTGSSTGRATQYTLYDGNKFYDSGSDYASDPTSPGTDNPAIQNNGRNSIIRFNEFDNNGWGITTADSVAGETYGDNHRIYHNTLDDSGIYGIRVAASLGLSAINNIAKNNIVSDTTDRAIYIAARDSGLTNSFEKNNIHTWDRIWVEGTTSSIDDANTNEDVFTDNVDVNPLFTDEINRDFTLQQGSPMVDTGVYLTTVSSVDGNAITVADASYFYTGAGSPWLIPGETADTLYDDDGNSSLIVSISGNVITVVDATGFAGTDNVTNVDWKDSGPDIGAYERDADPPDPPGVPLASTTFFWTAEATTLDHPATDYSAGDTTATANNSVTLSDTAEKNGTYGILSDGTTVSRNYSFDISSDDIINDAEGVIGFWFYITTWDATAGLFRARYDNDDYFQVVLLGTEELRFYWEYSTTADSFDTTGLALNTGTWYFLEAAWKASTNLRSIQINNGTPETDSTAISVMGNSPTVLSIGDFNAQSEVVFIDHVHISSDSTADLYQYRDYPAQPTATPTITDTYLCDAAGTEITIATAYTYGEVARICVVGSEAFEIDDLGAWGEVTLATDAVTFDYCDGAYSTKLIFCHTVGYRVNDADIDIAAADSLADGTATIEDDDGNDWDLDLTGLTDLGGYLEIDGTDTAVTVSMPTDFATFAQFEAIYPKFVPNDQVESFVNESWELDTDDDGTSGNLIRIIWRPTVIGKTLNLNNNDYIWVLVPTGTTVTNDGGTGTTWDYFNGAAGL